jgi:hypothetical protein
MGQADIAVGISLTFPVSGFTAEKLDFELPEISVEDIPTSHQLTTTAMTFDPADLVDNGELSFSFHFEAGKNPPVGVKETAMILTFPDSTTWTFAGHMKSYKGTGALNQKMTGDAVVKVSGDIMIAPAGSGAGSGSFIA